MQHKKHILIFKIHLILFFVVEGFLEENVQNLQFLLIQSLELYSINRYF